MLSAKHNQVPVSRCLDGRGVNHGNLSLRQQPPTPAGRSSCMKHNTSPSIKHRSLCMHNSPCVWRVVGGHPVIRPSLSLPLPSLLPLPFPSDKQPMRRHASDFIWSRPSARSSLPHGTPIPLEDGNGGRSGSGGVREKNTLSKTPNHPPSPLSTLPPSPSHMPSQQAIKRVPFRSVPQLPTMQTTHQLDGIYNAEEESRTVVAIINGVCT